MYIVSYIPTEKRFYFTSNRDENELRKTLNPRTYSHGIHRLTYPKDMEKGGSWLAIHDNQNRLGCILNGKHLTEEEKKKYTVSRGNILLDRLRGENPLTFDKTNLIYVAPFLYLNLVFKSSPLLSKYFWDGKRLIKEELDINTPYIWTAPSLYDFKTTEIIQQKFLSFCENVQNIKTGNVIELHEELKSYLPESAVRKANGNLRTTSVTHFSNLGGKQKLFYKDILADKRYNYQL